MIFERLCWFSGECLGFVVSSCESAENYLRWRSHTGHPTAGATVAGPTQVGMGFGPILLSVFLDLFRRIHLLSQKWPPKVMDGTFNWFIYSYGISWGSMLTKSLSTANSCLQQWHKRTTWPFHLSFDLAPFCMNSVTYQKTRIIYQSLYGRENCNCHPVIPLKSLTFPYAFSLKKRHHLLVT